MARKVSEVSDKLPIQLSTSEIADAMEGLLWDFLQHRQLYTERASTRGLQLKQPLLPIGHDSRRGHRGSPFSF